MPSPFRFLVCMCVAAVLAGCAAPPPAKPVTQTTTIRSDSDGQAVIIARGEPKLWVDEVSGAPGDGNKALTRELIQLIDQAGLTFARSPGLADYFVTAIVDVSVIDNQREVVEIVWRMTDSAGTEIGQISQRNEVSRGLLHQDWGDTAFYVARGGLEGVFAILDSLGHPQP
ncbi:MAG: hypothetical protein RIC16_08125 [Rhodospirillales bacterium]